VAALETLVLDQEAFSKVNADLRTKLIQLQNEKIQLFEKERDSNHRLELASSTLNQVQASLKASQE